MSQTGSSEKDRLQEAYEKTAYGILGQPRLTLRIGQEQPVLSALMLLKAHETACFITAFNPGSVLCDAGQNQAAQLSLKYQLEARNLEFMDAAAIPLGSDWPFEPGFLVFGLARELAVELGKQFDQNAIVWFEPDAKAELVWMT